MRRSLYIQISSAMRSGMRLSQSDRLAIVTDKNSIPEADAIILAASSITSKVSVINVDGKQKQSILRQMEDFNAAVFVVEDDDLLSRARKKGMKILSKEQVERLMS